MSSTRNSQNVLVNILRPTYYFDGSGFTSGVVVSNVKTVAAATVRTDNLDIGDPGCNIYLGAGAGTSWATNTTNTSNTALGLNAASGISNVSNSVFIGSGSGAGLASANSTIVVGTGVGVYGSSNTILGSRNVVIGSNNVVIGSDICLNDSYKLNIGNLIVGDICLNQGLRFTTNVVIEGTVECAAFNAGALDTSNLVVPGYIRNAGGLTVATMDLSGGNFRFAGLGVSRVSDVSFYQGRVDASWGIRGTGYDLSSGFILTGDVSANRFIGAPDTSNYIGGVTLNSSNLSLLGTITGVTDNTSNKIGGVTLSNTNISYAGSLVGSTNNTSNKIGGVTLSNTNISYAGTITGSTDNTSNKIGGVTLSNTNISYAGTIIGSTDNTSNSIGGVVLSNGILQASRLQDKLGGAYFDIQSNQIVYAGRLSNADATQSNSIGGITLSNNILAASVIRNALSSATIDMSGGNISNAGTHTSSNFIGTSSASNSIGGVTLSNTNISYAGTITGSTDNTSNKIGGVTLSNTNISYAGAITGSTDAASNKIGGVTLSNTNISYTGTITGSTDNTSNKIGGVTLSNTNITTTGIINGTNAAQSNSIGGVTLWNNNVSNSGTTTSSNFSGTSTASNSIGGVTLSNTNITYAGAITGSTDAASNKIGGVTLSNTGIVYAGAISNSVINQSNSIGGVTLSNGVMRAGYGSAGVPGISFSNDTDTGIFGGTNVLAFSTGGTGRMYIESNGRIGIGITPASYRLEVSNSETTNNDLRITGGAGNVANSGGALAFSAGQGGASGFMSRIKGVLSNAIVGTEEQGGIIFETRASNASSGQALTERVRIDANGSVGIGNATPAYSFDISAGNTANTMRVQATNYPSVLLSTPTSAGSGQVLFDGIGSKYILRASAVPLVFENPGNTERMRIGTDGNVGIGTSSPAYMLDVNGITRTTTALATNLYPVSTSDVSAIAYIRMSGGDFSNLPFLWLRQGGGPARYSGINFGSFNTNSMYFYNANGTLRVKSMDTLATSQSQLDVCSSILSINQTGKVGVGVETPAYTLDVGATAGTASVNMSTWPRNSVSNVCIIRGVAGSVGNTINFSNAGVQNTIDTNLMTVVQSNGTTGASFKFLKSGVWSICFLTSNSSGNSYTWLDASTNDVATVNLFTAGSPVLTHVYGSSTFNPSMLTFTGYIPGSSANFYKFRVSPAANLQTGNSYYIQISLLYETPSSAGTFPY